ncbi:MULTISPECIES: hypothetical protein [Microbacterium]|jgi:hypothetical protein|uniref:Uncharacterized protein n=1 Tax=Microbacterium mcarthurae TaxID=3035918 RepID=A0ABW9GIK7_9MICO|nr:hypothetical protein [Microbacterium sp. ACRRU]MCG7417062.1 hypothetical protein [Microbacterium sp. ACRRU]
MSLLAIAEDVRAARTRRFSLLAGFLIAAAITVGLLSMHVLNTHGTIAGHHGTVAGHHATVAGDHGDHGTGAVAPDHGERAQDPRSVDAAVDVRPLEATAGPVCAGCPSDSSTAWMACVLGLLVTVIAMVVVGARSRHRDDLAIVSAALARRRLVLRSLPPPSLTTLCISRT